jgi:hypothetical protein
MSLEKLAAKQPLSKEDMILAAQEYAELEKQAADADAYGRDLAHKYVEELVKKAAEEAKEKEETEEEKKAREAKEKEAEKTASDKELASAIQTLKDLGLLK